MRKITKLLAPALIAAMGLGAAIPAEAAAPQHHVANTDARTAQSLRAQIDQLQRQVAGKSRSLRNEVASIRSTYSTYSRGGINAREARALQQRIDAVKARLRTAEHGQNHTGDRGGHRR